MRRRGTVSRKPAKPQHRKLTRPKRSNAPTAARHDLQEQVSALTHKLAEALEQQTVTSEVLRLISSSPGELAPVFQTMLERAVRICEAKFGMLYLYDGDAFHAVSHCNAPPAFVERGPIHPDPRTAFGRVRQTRQVVQIADITKEEPYIEGDPLHVTTVQLGGFRTVLMVPMLKEDKLIGAVSTLRQEVRPFTDKQSELAKNFAAQAVSPSRTRGC